MRSTRRSSARPSAVPRPATSRRTVSSRESVAGMAPTSASAAAGPGLADAAARLAAIVDSSNDVIVSKTLDGIITSWNPAAERLFGWTAAEAVGQPITLIIPEERRAEEEDTVLARVRRGE